MKTRIIKWILGLVALTAPMAGLADVTFSGPTWYDYRDQSLVVDGKGTFLDPIVISTPEQLAQLSWLVNEKGNTFKEKVVVLDADIDLTKEVNGKRVEWVPIGMSNPFQGVFLGMVTSSETSSGSSDSEGVRASIKGMYINASLSGRSGIVGLFGSCEGFIGYLDIREASITAIGTGSIWNKPDCSAGLLCGEIYNADQVTFLESAGGKSLKVVPGITAVSVEGSITVDGNDGTSIGGICGILRKGEVAHSTADVVIKNAGRGQGIGGITGVLGIQSTTTESCIIDCAARISLSCTKEPTAIGGISGVVHYTASVRGCSSTGIMSGRLGTYVGGIVGDQSFRTDVVACTSTVSFENITSVGTFCVGGITGRLGEADSGTTVDNCVFAGYIDASTAMEAGGICAIYTGSKEQHVINSIFLGTLKRSTLAGARCGAIIGESPKPIETVVACYYDKQLFSGEVVSGFKSELSIFGLSTSELMSGELTHVSMLPTDDSDEYGFTLRAGYYPMVFFNGKSKGSDVLAANRPNSDIARQLFGSDQRTDNSIYQPVAWIASVPAVISRGDCADDFVSTLTVSEYSSTWTEGDGRTVNVQSEAVLPEAACVAVDGPTVTAKTSGSYVFTVGCQASMKNVTAERPKAISGEKRLQLNVTLGKIWDGSTATECAAGKGTAEDPFIIKNGAQLAYAVTNNKAGEHYKQICDIVLNTNVVDDEGSAHVFELKDWVKGHWDAHYDGLGNIVYGMYTDSQDMGLFGDVGRTAEISHLGVAESVFGRGASGMLARNVDGKVFDCFVQGIVNIVPPQTSMTAKTYGICRAGGICATIGLNNPEAVVEDCISAVYSQRAYSDYTPFVSLNDNNRGTVRNCLAVVPTYFANTEWTEFDFSAAGHDYIKDCYWLKGYESTPTGWTLDEIGSSLGARSRWTWTSGYFPTLKTFAETDIAKLMTVPVRTDMVFGDMGASFDENMLLGFSRHMEFAPGTAQWEVTGYYNEGFVDADADMGIITPVSTTIDPTYKVMPYMRSLPGMVFLKGTLGDRSILIPMRTTSGNVSKGITFVDDHARQACLDAFDTDKDGNLSLAELKAVTNDQTLTAFQTATARRIKTFPEFRFFKNVTELTSQLNGLTDLESVQLPYALKTIGAEAFKDCSSLKEVKVSSKVVTVRPRAFYGSSVENILVDPFNEKFVSRDGLLFTTADELVSYPNGRVGEEAVVAGTVKRIAEGAVYKVPGLRRLYFDTTNFNTVPRIVNGSIVTDDDTMMDVYVSDATYDQTLMRKYQANSSWAAYDRAGKLHQNYPLKVDDGLFYEGTEHYYLAAMCIGFDTTLPEELTPFVVEEADREHYKAILAERPRQVPSTAAVIIAATKPGVYRLMPLEGAAELQPWPLYENRLVGTDRNGLPLNQSTAAQGSIMTLGYDEDANLGFYPDKRKTMPPYYAYLPYNTVGMDPDIAVNAHYDIAFRYIADVALIDGADNSEVLTKYDGQMVNVTYDRRLRAIDNGDGTWTSRAYTICLPYNFGVYHDNETCSVSLFRLVSVTDDYEFVFTNDFSYLSAGIPYLIVVNKGELCLNADYVKLNAKPSETGHYNMIYATYPDAVTGDGNQVGWWRGTFRTISNEEGSEMHAFALNSDGRWKVIRNDTEKYRTGYLPTFRAYYMPIEHTGNWIYDIKFHYSEAGDLLNNGLEGFPSDSFAGDITCYDDDFVGINPVIHTIDRDGTHRYYDLQGRPLPGRPDNGLYIENGKVIMNTNR